MRDGLHRAKGFVGRMSAAARESAPTGISSGLGVRFRPHPEAARRRLPTPPLLRSPWIAPAALAVAIVSLAANAWLIAQLRAPERLIEPAAARVLTRLAEQDARLRYEIRVPAGTPLHFDVPVDERYTVKLRTSLPINTDVRLPLNTPFGQRTVTVPVRTTIPIRQDVPFHVVDTFRLRTQTRTEYVVPLEVRVRDLPLDQIRKSLDP
jgi:hypothetical protein